MMLLLNSMIISSFCLKKKLMIVIIFCAFLKPNSVSTDLFFFCFFGNLDYFTYLLNFSTSIYTVQILRMTRFFHFVLSNINLFLLITIWCTINGRFWPRNDNQCGWKNIIANLIDIIECGKMFYKKLKIFNKRCTWILGIS